MGSTFSFDLFGMNKVISKITKATDGIPGQFSRAMNEEAELISTESKKRTPVDTGSLRASHRVEIVETGDDIEVWILVGGPAAGKKGEDVGYGVYVHEDTEAEHRVGEYHFLKKSIDEKQPIMKRVSKRIDFNRTELF